MYFVLGSEIFRKGDRGNKKREAAPWTFGGERIHYGEATRPAAQTRFSRGSTGLAVLGVAVAGVVGMRIADSTM